MAALEKDAQVDTVSHVENVSDHEKQHQTQEEVVLGRDFTVSDSELPKGYFTSANFLGSSMLSVYLLLYSADPYQCSPLVLVSAVVLEDLGLLRQFYLSSMRILVLIQMCPGLLSHIS